MHLFALLPRWYWNFNSRLDRRTYWLLTLIYLVLVGLGALILGFALGGVPGLTGASESTIDSTGNWIAYVLALAVSPLQWSMNAGRLHDIGRTGWLQLLALIPVVGVIVLFWMMRPGMPETNVWGPPVNRSRPAVPATPEW